MDLSKEAQFTHLLSAGTTVTATGASSVLTIGSADRITFIVSVGAVAAGDASNYFAFTVLEGTVVGTQAGVAEAGQYIAHGSWDLKINATAEADNVYAFDFVPTPGYGFCKVAFTETGTASAVFSIDALTHVTHTPAT